jgi:hypothetical protein
MLSSGMAGARNLLALPLAIGPFCPIFELSPPVGSLNFNDLETGRTARDSRFCDQECRASFLKSRGAFIATCSASVRTSQLGWSSIRAIPVVGGDEHRHKYSFNGQRVAWTSFPSDERRGVFSLATEGRFDRPRREEAPKRTARNWIHCRSSRCRDWNRPRRNR